jgi:hypothetical protein
MGRRRHESHGAAMFSRGTESIRDVRLGRALASLILLGLLATYGEALADSDDPWQRSAAVLVSSGPCQELAVARPGDGFLELRLESETRLPVGIDSKIRGASVFVPGSGDRATIILCHTTGLYPLTVSLDGPLRWRRDGRRLCVGAGSRTLVCGLTNGEVQ